MSRMTKFLRQTCEVQPFKSDRRGNAILDDFGELMYLQPVQYKCRCERSHKDIKTTNGSLIRSTSRYYLDNSADIKPDYKIDGNIVLDVSEYINGLGQIEGYEVYV